MADRAPDTNPFLIDFPSEHEDELIRRFRVTLNYLVSVQYFLAHRYGHGNNLYPGLTAALNAHPAFIKLHKRSLNDNEHDRIQRHLEIAWVTELVLRMPAALGSGRALQVTNAWAPVHAYYSVNMTLQAWFDANGMVGLTDDHTATLRSISNQIRDRHLFPAPWSLLCNGNPHKSGGCNYVHEPSPGACSGKIEPLSIPTPFVGAGDEDDFFRRLGMWLRTTREARLKASEAAWKAKHKRTKIDPKERKRAYEKLHGTSLFDCLWRLRIRSNYRSVETYLVRHVSDSDALVFHRSLVFVTRATLCLIESYVSRMVGAERYEQLANAFLANDGEGLAGRTLGKRLPHVLAAAKASGN